MKILSHRGYWQSLDEKNTIKAFERSFQLGFGTETDLRDHNGKIVISHDMPFGEELSFRDFMEIVSTFSSEAFPLTLALNIKADGLQKEVLTVMETYDQVDYFLFDMSIPDMHLYLKHKLPIYTRLSDIEQYPVYFNESEGIWLDNFSETLWYNEETLSHLLLEKKVCVVSSELHQQDPNYLWEMLLPFKNNEHLTLCTDKPEDAYEFFHN